MIFARTSQLVLRQLRLKRVDEGREQPGMLLDWVRFEDAGEFIKTMVRNIRCVGFFHRSLSHVVGRSVSVVCCFRAVTYTSASGKSN